MRCILLGNHREAARIIVEYDMFSSKFLRGCPRRLNPYIGRYVIGALFW
jgi:hypothetical protein